MSAGRPRTPVVAPVMLRIPTRGELRRRPLLTPRLTLVPLEVGDAHDLWVSVEGSRSYLEPWLPWVPYQNEPAASGRFTEACVNDWDCGRALRFAIRERGAPKSFLGVVSLESLQHLHLSCDLGYWLRHDVNGRGYMTEAARATVEWAMREMGAYRVRVAAATDNHRSLAVIRRLGFRFEGIARSAERIMGRWLDHAIFARLATDA